MSRSSLLLIVALAVVAVLVHALFFKGPGTARPRAVQHRSAIADEQPSIDVTPVDAPQQRDVRPPREASAPDLDADDTAPPTTANPEVAQKIAASLRRKARFPPTSRRIENNVNPIVQTRAVKERLSPPSQGRTPTLVVFSSSLSYEAPSPIILFAKFIRDYPGDWSPLADAEIAGELVNAADEVVAQVDLRDDGQERDIEAGDGIFTTRLTPPAEDLAQWNGLIRARVYGRTGDGERRSATTRFYYGLPSAKLTGNYRDQLVDGHLQVLAEIDVKEPGEYRLDATLSGAQGLLAWAQNTVVLAPGLTWMPLTFWGLALREANQPGPYELSSVALANMSEKPPQLNDATGTTYKTAAYKPGDFSAEPFDDPKLIERAERVEAKARGQ